MTLRDDLIEIALQDIKASRLLYNKKLYAQSYFYFQQASEKATKAYGLFTEIIKEEDLKKDIQHNQLKIYFKAIVKEENEIRSFVETLNKRPDIANHAFIKRVNVETYRKNLEDGLKFHHQAKQLDLLTYTKDELLYYLENLEEMYSVKIRFSQEMKSQIMKELKTYVDFATQFGTKTEVEELKEALSDKNIAEFYSILNTMLKHWFRFIFINYTFYFSALVTIRHSNLSRYPDGAENPLKFYNLKNPSVKYQLDFLFQLERGLIALRNVIKTHNTE